MLLVEHILLSSAEKAISLPRRHHRVYHDHVTQGFRERGAPLRAQGNSCFSPPEITSKIPGKGRCKYRLIVKMVPRQHDITSNRYAFLPRENNGCISSSWNLIFCWAFSSFLPSLEKKMEESKWASSHLISSCYLISSSLTSWISLWICVWHSIIMSHHWLTDAVLTTHILPI